MGYEDDHRYQDYIDDENRSLDIECYCQQQRKLSNAIFDNVREGNIDEAKRLLGVPPTQNSSASLNEISNEEWRTPEGQSKLLRRDASLVRKELDSKFHSVNPSVAEHITNIIDFTTVNEDADILKIRAIV